MSTIAIIVPVYNVESQLQYCIDSIVAQTFSDFILVLIDDGSTDNSPGICDTNAYKDPRVHVIHQENAGPASARNRGIDWALAHTECEYLAFVDSDDCLHPNYLAQMYLPFITESVQVCMCRHQYIMPGEIICEMPITNTNVQLYSAEDLLLEQFSSFNYAWGKLFSRECFASTRFPEDVSFGEDNLIIFRILFSCEKIAFIDEKMYYYFYNAHGITKSPWNPHNLAVFDGIKAQLLFYEENGFYRAYQKQIELYIQQCAYQIHRIRENTYTFKKYKTHLFELKRQMRFLLLKNKAYHLWDNFYWFEALHPNTAAVCKIIFRFWKSIKQYGFIESSHKVYGKCVSFCTRRYGHILKTIGDKNEK